jgi:response regulator RpfG family c-di-GMP phosphodiesterase
MDSRINRVFYTDDDQDDHEMFSMALAEIKPAAVLHPFFNCSEIVDYLKDESKALPDIIFLDQNMPGNTGNECLREIKQIARAQNIPVVMYTTGGNPKLVGNALELGAYKYVLKPVYHKEIKSNLAEILAECEGLVG